MIGPYKWFSENENTGDFNKYIQILPVRRALKYEKLPYRRHKIKEASGIFILN